MSIPFVLPSRLADPEPTRGTTILENGVVFDATGAAPLDHATLRVDDGVISSISTEQSDHPQDARVIDLRGKFVMPGIIDCHTHLTIDALPEVDEGAEELRPGVVGHFVVSELVKALRMGITTIREVGAYGDTILEVRQAMRYGAFRGPRLLTCGRIVSATSPGGRHFSGMYREADGPDEMRKAAREQIRRGADFVKIMMTGARSVELENPGPSQVTREELKSLVEETHRQGYRVAAHCEGLEGTRLAIEEGVDTIEHGFYLHQSPELLQAMAARGGVLIPTLSFLHQVAETEAGEWSPHLVERGAFNLEEAYKTVAAALGAGVPLAMGFDSRPEEKAAGELALMVHAGLSSHEALIAATATGARALGLDDVIGTLAPGKIADLIVVDGNPLDDIGVLTRRDAISLVVQSGELVAGAGLEPSFG